jgi:hypothetical protein
MSIIDGERYGIVTAIVTVTLKREIFVMPRENSTTATSLPKHPERATEL